MQILISFEMCLKTVSVDVMNECECDGVNGDEDVKDYVGDLKAWNARSEVLKFEG